MYIKFLSITKTLRFRILFPLMLIILSVSFLEIYYLNHYAFTVVEDIVLDTKAKNASQVLNGIERYFSNIETIAKKPLNTIEISSLLRKDYTNLSITEKSKDKYSIQMFLFREIMLPNPDIESSLIYDTSEKDYYAISDTYALYKDSYYSFNAHDTDFSKLQATDGVPFISGIKKSNMLVQPHDDYIVTYGIGFNNHFKTENSLYGAFYINIKASAFAELCSRNYVENTGDCYLLDQNDHIVFCEQKDLIGTDICDSFPLKNQLKNTTASAISDKQYVYTLTNVSDTTGWRVATISNTSNVFSYRQTRNLFQEGSHRFDVFLFHMGDDLQFLRSISCHDSGSCGGFDSTQSTGMWNNHAFYIFYNISADRNLHPLRQGSQYLSGNSSRISDGDRLGTSHRRHQFIFQDLDISSVIFF